MLTELVHFLYLNPGAYEAWEELEQFSSRSREVLLPHMESSIEMGYAPDYLEFIRGGVERFEQAEQ